MAKKRYYSESSSSRENKRPPHFNDAEHHDKDALPNRMYRGPLRDAELYSGMDSRKRLELEDSAMIHEDHRAIANLPQEVMIKPYPMVGPYLPEVLNDDVSGVDAQMDYDDGQRRAHFYPKKV